jgi:hypothetical protein
LEAYHLALFFLTPAEHGPQPKGVLALTFARRCTIDPPDVKLKLVVNDGVAQRARGQCALAPTRRFHFGGVSSSRPPRFFSETRVRAKRKH